MQNLSLAAIFLKQDMGRYAEKCFTRIYRDLCGDVKLGQAHPNRLQHGGRKPTETSLTEL